MNNSKIFIDIYVHNLFKTNLLLCFLLIVFSLFSYVHAKEYLCAEVKIEIVQELTLERQAFDAHMRINNGIEHIDLENVQVDVYFMDKEEKPVLATSDSDNTDALFYIRVDTMDNIDDVNGNGVVKASTSADIHWLIIPAPGASNGNPGGTLYYAGAKLTYTIGGDEHFTEVVPDYIYVKPMPELTLDYFLPYDVYGDDAFTPDIIEPSIPFSLGVRIKNSGFGIARKVKIESAQPKIVENEQGLLVNFVIEGSEVQGEEFLPDLLVDFGDIDPDSSKVARWIMTTTLSGRFVEFKARYTHASELGGELTSLLKEVHTHTLIRNVFVDLPGRDHIKDFLAQDEDSYRVYESENLDTIVINRSGQSSLNPSGNNYVLSLPSTQGLVYIKQNDPFKGSKLIKDVFRSDGKKIDSANAWLSKTRNGTNWQYYFNLFDCNTTNEYTISFEDQSNAPQAPILAFIPHRHSSENKQISFLVEASDPNNTIPSLSGSPLPAGASFEDRGNGKGLFDWTPQEGQAGKYEITFVASDGTLKDNQHVLLTICTASDSDCDQMDDAWEMANFNTLDRDGSGDLDQDGISDLNEYLNHTDPTAENTPPSPEIIYPKPKEHIATIQPDLIVKNTLVDETISITNMFEIYLDKDMSNLLSKHTQDVDYTETSLSLAESLTENTWYYWRVRATEGSCFSPWVYGSFFVNIKNDPPGPFEISYPQNQIQVDTLTPVLEVTNSVDPDGDPILYRFELYSDAEGKNLIVQSSNMSSNNFASTLWQLTEPLENNHTYYCKVVALDSFGDTTSTSMNRFFVDINNHVPSDPQLLTPGLLEEIQSQHIELIVQNAIDEDLDTIHYYFEVDVSSTFDSSEKIISGMQAEEIDTTSWYIDDLKDNQMYYWRVKASDGQSDSHWMSGAFFVNTENDRPSIPVVKNPDNESWVNTLTPALKTHDAYDIDNDEVSYQFEIYSDANLFHPVGSGQSDIPEWVVTSTLMNNTWYYWRACSIDSHGVKSLWTETQRFFTNEDDVNDPPYISLIEPDNVQSTNQTTISVKWDDSDTDNNAEISFYVDSDNSGENGILVIQGIQEDQDGLKDSYELDVSNVNDGQYYVYAVIDDGTSKMASYSSGKVIIDSTAPEVTASPSGSNFDSEQHITLNTNETATIYYTLDDTDPNMHSNIYDSFIVIDKTTKLKFFAVDALGNRSETKTEIYAISDQDQDGVSDNLDDFPTDPNEWTDTDKDGIGNNADTDDDNDSMPDTWEETYGLDPLVDDALMDLDNDGITNVDEYAAGKNPARGNRSPEKPELKYPLNGQTNVEISTHIQTKTFLDPDGIDFHHATEWQVSTNKDSFETKHLQYTINTQSYLTALTIPDLILNENTKYFIRVRFYDNYNKPSEWSDVYSFKTKNDENDNNSNGIPDTHEVESSDMDDNGILDEEQTDIKCIQSFDSSAQLAVRGDAESVTVNAIRTIDPQTITQTTDRPKEFPMGLMSFKLDVQQLGDETEITVYFSKPAPDNAKWYKYDVINGWKEYSEYSTFSDDRKSIKIRLKDGSYGDADGTINGVIIDPGGLGVDDSPVVPTNNNNSDDGGGSCFISIIKMFL